jgi:hypothetical protein
VRRVTEGREDILSRERILVGDSFDAEAGGPLADDDVDGNARPLVVRTGK